MTTETIVDPRSEAGQPRPAARRLGGIWRRALRIALAAGLLAALNCGAAGWMLWRSVDSVASAIGQRRGPLAEGLHRLTIHLEEKDGGRKPYAEADIAAGPGRFDLRAEVAGRRFGLGGGETTYVDSVSEGVRFSGGPTAWPESREALAEVVSPLAGIGSLKRIAAVAWLRPWISGARREGGRWVWRIRTRYGEVGVAPRGGLRWLSLRVPVDRQHWTVDLRAQAREAAAAPSDPPPREERVPAEEIDLGLAEGVRILALAAQPVAREPDRFEREGAAWLRVRDGQRLLYLEGSPREIGYQHGRLLAPNVRRLTRRVIYGVGLYYSVTRGRWFPSAAAGLHARQSPWIAPEYEEEMRGLAEGAGVPLADVQRANIFPEFFHCSGVAAFGRATADGSLVHARVLDYMTGIGLQDEAVVIAMRRTGAIPWVNVGFAGFIGSVTGMNERKVAIGEMGGGGEGEWDGTPMSFLVRGALEHAETLDAALAYMRDRPRTCEYFYVISDGKGPDAAGVAATPGAFDVVRPGETMDRLPEAIPDVIALSSGDRYTHLVRRIREHHGRIDADVMAEIIRRPVAMKSNLHNAIFEPQALRMRVTVAGRHSLACDQPPAVYTWPEMFP